MQQWSCRRRQNKLHGAACLVWSAAECHRRGNQPVPLSLRACVRTEYTDGRHFKRLLR